jgi:4-hydroxy-L-threonine phosphate dehydrogenase PdxA
MPLTLPHAPRIGVCGLNPHARDHGTAFDIARQDKTDAQSLGAAIRVAVEWVGVPESGKVIS